MHHILDDEIRELCESVKSENEVESNFSLGKYVDNTQKRKRQQKERRVYRGYFHLRK